MNSARTRNKPVNNAGFLDTIKEHYLVILGLIFAVPVIMRYLKDAETKNNLNDAEENIKALKVVNLSPVTQQSELNKISKNKDLQSIARSLKHDLGTAYNWWDYAAWTENDNAAYKQLKRIKLPIHMRAVVRMYFVLVQRNLYDDVKRLLDPELLAKLPLLK
jgi:hypothetical protein